MELTTLIVLMAFALVVMAVVVGTLVVRLIHKNNELKEKNDVIVREVRRNQTLIDRAVQQGVSRAAMLSVSLLLLGSVSVLTSCSKDDETIYTPDPTDAPRTSPLVTVVYSPDALGDKSYNDLIYSGVEAVSTQKELRTLHLSPATKEEGLAYLEDIFRQMEAPDDTVRRLLIVASSDYDEWLRQNNKRLEGNPRADLLYFETSKPLDGKGYTLFMPYYGAMYMAGALAPYFLPKVLLIGANPEDESVSEAMQGFKDGFATELVATSNEKSLTTMYISQHAGEGYSITDTLALKMMQEYKEQSEDWFGKNTLIVPVCGGANSVFMRLSAILYEFIVMGIDVESTAVNSQFSAVKHIDWVVETYVLKWASGVDIPKHQSLGLASTYTGLVTNVHPYWYVHFSNSGEPSVDLFGQIHDEAVRMEELRMKNEELKMKNE